MSDWRGRDWDRISRPHVDMGTAALDRLEANGFTGIEAWLQPHPISFETRDEMLDYMVTPWLRPATGLPDRELHRVADAAIDHLGELSPDYVRLNVIARRG